MKAVEGGLVIGGGNNVVDDNGDKEGKETNEGWRLCFWDH